MARTKKPRKNVPLPREHWTPKSTRPRAPRDAVPFLGGIPQKLPRALPAR